MKKSVLYALLAGAIIIAIVAMLTASVATRTQTAQEVAWAAKETAYQEMLQETTQALWDAQETNSELSQTIYEQQEKINSMRFVPLDVDIPLDDQALAFAYSTMHDIPYKMPLFVGLNETGWTWMVDVMDTNGLPSTGYLMVNKSAWSRLEAVGIDVHTKGGAIHGGIFLMAEQAERANSWEQTLIFYECGYAGGQGITSTKFSRKIMDNAQLWDVEFPTK